MTDYAIGDIQGCHTPLVQLLEKLAFDPEHDRLWFTGDLVNRGPDSLATLRLVKELGERALCVLGNHDLHLLAVHAGHAKQKKRDTLGAVLAAPDCDELTDWLRSRPLAIYQSGFLMVHAGVLPQWDITQTLHCAAEVESTLRSDRCDDFLRDMYGDEPAAWSDTLTGTARLRCIVNALTRLRYCDADGRMQLDAKGSPGTEPAGYLPWFRVPGRNTSGAPVIFGHWSTLGDIEDAGVYGLDSGCVWGGRLSAMPLDQPKERITVLCSAYQNVPGSKSR
ncbi:MAG: symmetrical bis(5'-nucleosyl)-tetraphosphatase [Gammaproteobacteria bacterium]|nr:symmetrical bis(5'-nucleosyl)-tetraphosphatase [Gammaproteobacteria bacterium]NNF60750.1 symmetrical bis(5'-nucleosyl)-tetraphosphatase [Gammaproteobacteria bacterium]NNM20239.1 symmetrical bis(5'-nucleosyl)-tetraphosphatase [Gammaproteobacteria bacterium]